jgi:hypothetical protein
MITSRRFSSGITDTPIRARIAVLSFSLKRTLAHLRRAALAAALLGGGALPASAQVFLATSPHPDFTIGPLILQAIVPQDLGTVQVNISWSLSVPTGRTPPKAEDLTTHRRFGFGWLATVSHRDIEHHEVVVEIEDDRVRDVEWRVGRSRAD